MSTRALIGLGSNLGDRKARLDSAVASLAATPGVTVRAVSSYHETAPIGGPGGQGAFLNAAAALETALEPEPLLDVLHAIEADSGRVRAARWGEQTLDLDLLLCDTRVIETDRLRVPHPRTALRRFVLAPLAEIAPEALDPVTGRTVRDLLSNLDRRPSYVSIASPPGRSFEARGLRDRLRRELPATPVESRGVELLRPEHHTAATFKNARLSDPERLAASAAALDAAFWTSQPVGDGWVVSAFWFDTHFLGRAVPSSDLLPPSREREPFLAFRAKVLPATFVVMRQEDRIRQGLVEPHAAWHRPIGWDTPVLEVGDLDSDSTLIEVLATCAATRAGRSHLSAFAPVGPAAGPL